MDAFADLPIDVNTLRDVLRAHDVEFALLFGSRATGTANSRSDVDVAAHGAGPLEMWNLRAQIPEIVDLIDLSSAPDDLKGRIAMEGLVIMDDDPGVRVRWQAETRKRFLDEASRRARFMRDFMAAHG